VRSINSLNEIDDCPSNNSTVCAVRSTWVPELFVAMGAHYFVRDAVIEGATHGFTPCTRCETTPGQYANSVKNLFDYVRGWIAKRYPIDGRLDIDCESRVFCNQRYLLGLLECKSGCNLLA